MRRCLSSLLFFVLFLTGCGIGMKSTEPNQEPPTPVVTVGNEKIPVFKGTYTWSPKKSNSNGGQMGKSADYPIPPDIVKNQKPSVVPAGSELVINFDYKPQNRTLGASQWVNRKPITEKILDENKIILPKKKGVYVYEFYAKWDEGNSGYIIIVQVE